MKKTVGLVLMGMFLVVSLGGCACGPKEVKSEPAPAQVSAPEPMPVKPLPPPKKDRN